MSRLVGALALLSACGGGSGDQKLPTDPGSGNGLTPSISISLGAATISVTQGTATDVVTTVTRSGGYAGSVNLSVSDVPTGVTATVGAGNTSGATTSTAITLQVSSGTAPGAYTLTVTGQGSGVTATTAAIHLTVTPAPNFTLAVNPATLTMVQGASRNDIALSITRTNFNDAVALALATPVPSGVSATFTPASIGDGATTSILTLVVASSAAPGTYTVTINGTGTAGARSVAMALTVEPAPAIALGLTPSGVVTLEQGGVNNSKTVTIARTNFAGAIALTADNVPAGLTATFSPANTTGNSAILTVSASPSVAVSVTPIVITIRGTGATALRSDAALAATIDATTTVSVTVVAQPRISLGITAGNVTLQQGNVDNAKTVSITRTNYTPNVTFTAEGLPAGMTATFGPNPASGNSVTLTLAAASTVPVSVMPQIITIRGTGPAANGAPGAPPLEATATVSVMVTAGGSFTFTVTPTCGNSTYIQTGILNDNRRVRLARTNFASPIALSIDDLPAGVTASFVPVAGDPNVSMLRLTASGAVALNSYPVTIRGIGPTAPGGPALTQFALAHTIVVLAASAPSPNVLSYDFVGGFQGWDWGVSCLDKATPDWGAAIAQENMTVLDGSDFGPVGDPNAWLSKEITIPTTVKTLQFDVSAHVFAGNDAMLRIRILDDGVFSTAYEERIAHSGASSGRQFTTKTVDISRWSGKTVRVYFEQDNNGFLGTFPGNGEQIWLDNILFKP